jgi:CRP-like cAMP-binding protein
VNIRERFGPNGGNRLLSALRQSDFSLLAPDLKEVSLKLGVPLHEPGERIEHVYFPQNGMISLLAVMQDGGAVEAATVGREGAVGAMAGLGLGPQNAFSRAVVQAKGDALRIRVPRFQAAILQSAPIRNLVLRYQDVLLSLIQQSAGCNALHQVEARLSRWLLQTRDRTDSDTLPLTQEFLSQMLGVRRTTVTLVARVLQSAGLIKYSRGRIVIIDRSGLEKRACECYAVTRRRSDEVFSKTKQ